MSREGFKCPKRLPGNPGCRQSERQITCNGEALFDIDPKYAIPTVIKTLKQEVTVLGTLFKCRDFKTEDTGAVFCYNGRVSVRGSNKTKKILDSAQRATVHPGRGIGRNAKPFTANAGGRRPSFRVQLCRISERL